MNDRPVRIIDATLREGMQAANGAFTTEQSVEVARCLIACGVDTVECGHPAIGHHEQLRVAAVVEACGAVPVLAHARANNNDVDAVAKTGADWVGIFLGVNEISLNSRLPGCSRDDVHCKIDESVGYARQLGLQVRFTVEDSSRTDIDLLVETYTRAIRAGAGRIGIADTVGVLEPGKTGELVRRLVSSGLDADIEVHLHDDRGLALANALAAIDAGATWVSTSVNGLGERAGIVDLGALLANLDHRGTRTCADGRRLRDLSRRVGAYSRSAPDDRRPVVGKNVFRHVSRLHLMAVDRDPASYEWIAPELFGAERVIGGEGPPRTPAEWIVKPPVVSATELRHHRAGPGDRFVLVDDRFVAGAGQYCIARRIPELASYGTGHVDGHVHHCDSLFVFLGTQENYQGLEVDVHLGEETFRVLSPASVFIPAGVRHSYQVVAGSGTYLNHVLAGDYNSSLLDPPVFESRA
ncbi:hypothetical protein [Streptomyces sp. NPDC020607]|uniref:homocitrate synthase/isopropylmalate synthase family protein n=1 Tax=Streptomyces sp. NPDC020607 TaxID=3365082 RepID=UPI00379D278A